MRRYTVAVVAAGLIAGGCGGSALSDTQLRSQAGRICSLSSRQTDQIATPTSPAGTEAFLRRGISVLTPELAALRSLRPSGDLSDVYTTSVKALAGQLSDLDGAMRHLKHGEDPTIALKTLQNALGPLESQGNGGWQALQIPACVSR